MYLLWGADIFVTVKKERNKPTSSRLDGKENVVIQLGNRYKWAPVIWAQFKKVWKYLPILLLKYIKKSG